MSNCKILTLQDDIREKLKDPEFKQAWDESEAEYLLAVHLIEARLKKKLSQRQLAAKVKTSQAAISRIEAMNGNPSVALLKRIAMALGTQLRISFE
jgi:ribosome-binding protein aMBF1 (putative translation factor)